jgi:hypothetical protein
VWQAALIAAKEQSKDAKDEEIASLRIESQTARDEALVAAEVAREAEFEAKALRTMTHRMILTQEEMEEVVLKRCWLARYWALAHRHGTVCFILFVSWLSWVVSQLFHLLAYEKNAKANKMVWVVWKQYPVGLIEWSL